jgi:hypothetical protein
MTALWKYTAPYFLKNGVLNVGFPDASKFQAGL